MKRLLLVNFLDSLIYPNIKFEELLIYGGYLKKQNKISGTKVFKFGTCKVIGQSNYPLGSFRRNLEIKFEFPNLKNVDFKTTEYEWFNWVEEVEQKIEKLTKRTNLKEYNKIHLKIEKNKNISNNQLELYKELSIILNKNQ